MCKVFFFCCAPLGAACFFFALAPCRRPTGLLLPLPLRGAGANKNTLGGVFFLLWPRAGAQRGFSFPCLSPGPQQKKNTLGGVCFFALAPCRHGASPSPAFPRGRSKKKHPGWCFFCSGPARTLTHSLRAWVAMPPPRRGGAFFFAAAPPGPTGVVFFFLLWPRPDAHSLTVGWGDFGKARVVFFFLLRPRRVFLDNNKKCLGYYIGSKKTRRGHSKKKHHFHMYLSGGDPNIVP